MKITTKNYCPPCQLGKLRSSRISTDILALCAKNLQQLSASPDQKPSSQNSVLTVSPKVHKIQQCIKNRCLQQITTVQRLSTHGKTQPSRGSLLTKKHNSLCRYSRLIKYNPQHPSPPNGVHIPLFPPLIPPDRLTPLLHNHPHPPPYSFH
jgi:hypothetical protein